MRKALFMLQLFLRTQKKTDTYGKPTTLWRVRAFSMKTPNSTIELPKQLQRDLASKLRGLNIPVETRSTTQDFFSQMCDLVYSAVGVSEGTSFDEINAHIILLLSSLDDLTIVQGSETNYSNNEHTLYINISRLHSKSVHEIAVLEILVAVLDMLMVRVLGVTFDKNTDFRDLLQKTASKYVSTADRDIDALRIDIANLLQNKVIEHAVECNAEIFGLRQHTAHWFLTAKPSLIKSSFAHQIDSFLEIKYGQIPKIDLDEQAEANQIVSAMLEDDDVYIPSSFAETFYVRHNPMMAETILPSEQISVVEINGISNLLDLGVQTHHSALEVFQTIVSQGVETTTELPTSTYALFALLDHTRDDIAFVMKIDDHFFTLNLQEAFWVITL